MNRVLIGSAAVAILTLVAVSHSESRGQKQAAEPRIVAAGAAIWKLGRAQSNSTSVRVPLKEEIASKVCCLIAHEYIEESEGRVRHFLVDPEIGSTGSRPYLFEVNRDFPVDWIVVKK